MQLYERRVAAQERDRDRDRDRDRQRAAAVARDSESFRRTFLDHCARSSPAAVSHELEDTIAYLARIRALAGERLRSDLVVDTASLAKPHRTSWLVPGAVLSGYQHATTAVVVDRPRAGGPDPPQQDRWPVRVTIHAVDYADMSLAATMEAYNEIGRAHV